MKTKLLAGFAAGLFLFGAVCQSQADTLIDTGPGPDNAFGYTLSTNQWLAAEFDLDQDYYITGLYGWMWNSGNTGQNFTISIYGDGGNVPDAAN